MDVISEFLRLCTPVPLAGITVVVVVEEEVDMVAVVMEDMEDMAAEVDQEIAIEIATGGDHVLVPGIGEGDLNDLHLVLAPDLDLLAGTGKGQGGITDLDPLLTERTTGPRVDLDPRIGQGRKVLADQRIDLDLRVDQNRKIKGPRVDQKTVLDLRVLFVAVQRVLLKAVLGQVVTCGPDPSPQSEPQLPQNEILAVSQRADLRVGALHPTTEGRAGLHQEDDLAPEDDLVHGTRQQVNEVWKKGCQTDRFQSPCISILTTPF